MQGPRAPSLKGCPADLAPFSPRILQQRAREDAAAAVTQCPARRMQMLVSDEAGSAVCACPRAPPNPTIPTRLFPLFPSPSPQPRVLRLRRPPRLRSTEGQPSHSLTASAGIRHAVPRRPQAPAVSEPEPARRGRCAAQSLSPAWPALLLIGRHLGREGGPARAPAVAPPRADRRLRDTSAQRQQHTRTGLGFGGPPHDWPCPFAIAAPAAPAGNFGRRSPLPSWPFRDSSPNAPRGPTQRA